ncbi:MAG: DUF1549 domain-containing protein [Bacteroidota bacterium]
MNPDSLKIVQILSKNFNRNLQGAFLFIYLVLPPYLPAEEADNFSRTSIDKILEMSQQIDQLVEVRLKSHHVSRNPKLSDEAFVRRIYLDICGRIPTYKEALRFLDSKNLTKRSELIDELLKSDAYVSHFYHYWADLLRLKTDRPNNRVVGTVSYINWIKDSLDTNKPYNEFVREMITAEGYPWEEPAVGYYLRDFGMPLDNMSNTMQVFLGTQMQCAQCHNHPFDKWTQRDYYQLAAFTYGVETRIRTRDLALFHEFRNMAKKLRVEQDKKERKKFNREQFAGVKAVFEPLSFGAHQTGKVLKLPADYQYDDAQPKSKVMPKVPFGQSILTENGKYSRDAFADWLIADQNPRFSTVIANRLWKKVMGVALIEPVDNLKDDTEAENPQLMQTLSQVMRDVDYDMKQYLRILYNTRTYQSSAYNREIREDREFLFQGPKLRRMSAEQIWDSLLTLIVPDLDERKGNDRKTQNDLRMEESYKKRAIALESKSPSELYDLVKKISDLEMESIKRKQEFVSASKGDPQRNDNLQLRRELKRAERDKVLEIERLLAGSSMISGEAPMNRMTTSPFAGERANFIKKRRKQISEDAKWQGFEREWVRASELQSPVEPGHFLRQFGQSDRETIDNAYDDASVPQVLSLLNGPYGSCLASSRSNFRKTIDKLKSSKEKVEGIFLSFFSRYPSAQEADLIEKHLYGGKEETSDPYRLVATALLNSQEFRFIQ